MPDTIDSETLCGLIKMGRKALNGDSNDAEHDALHQIVESLEALQDKEKSDSSE